MEGEHAPPSLLDTGFVVRYLTGDPESLAGVAASVIDTDRPLLLTPLVLVETAHVLESVYGVRREEVVSTLADLVQRRNIVPLGLPKGLILTALELCRDSHQVSYVDALTWAQARHVGAANVHAFGRHFPSDGLETGPT